VLSALKDKKQYPELTSEARLDMIKASQQRIFQNNQSMKKDLEDTKDVNYDNIFSKMNDNTLSLKDIDDQMEISEDQGGIPKKQLLSIKRGIQKKIKDDITLISESNVEAKKYYDGIDGFIQNINDRNKAREYIVNAFRDNVLSTQEANYLNSLLAETKDIKDLRGREQFMNNKFVPFKNTINSVNDYFFGKKTFTESDKAIAIKKIINKIIQGDDPVKAKNEEIKSAVINKNPAITNLPEEGQKSMDEDGNIKLMFSDGTYKDTK